MDTRKISDSVMFLARAMTSDPEIASLFNITKPVNTLNASGNSSSGSILTFDDQNVKVTDGYSLRITIANSENEPMSTSSGQRQIVKTKVPLRLLVYGSKPKEMGIGLFEVGIKDKVYELEILMYRYASTELPDGTHHCWWEDIRVTEINFYTETSQIIGDIILEMSVIRPVGDYPIHRLI